MHSVYHEYDSSSQPLSDIENGVISRKADLGWD